MTSFKHKLHSILIFSLAILFGFAANVALAGNGKGKGSDKTNGKAADAVLAGNGNSNGKAKGKTKSKAIGLVNPLDGSTIEYGSSEAEGDGSSEAEDDSSPSPVVIGNSSSGNSRGKASGKSKNVGQGNASNGLKARIVTNQDIVYTGQTLEIGFQFARGSELITEGLAEAFLVIFSPPAGEGEVPIEPIILPLNPEIEEMTDGEDGSEEGGDSESTGEESTTSDTEVEGEEEPEVEDEAGPRNLFTVPQVDDQEIPAGTYQLGLILTSPGGDPLDLSTWYNGLLGLVHVRGLTVSAEALPADSDGDGMMDCEPEIEGMTCEEDSTEEDEDTSTDDSSTSTDSGDTSS